MQKRSLAISLVTGIICTVANADIANLTSDITSTEVNMAPTFRSQLATPAFQRPIKPSDLNHHATGGTGMYTINLSGRYFITQDLRPAPTVDNSYVIHITTSNVNLHMNHKTISRNQDASSGTGLTAISTDANLYNIQILDGIVQGRSNNDKYIGTGINIGSGSRMVTLRNVKVNQCNVAGITATSTNDLEISDCSANECTGSAATNGLSLTSCSDTIIKNSLFNKNTTSSGKAVGVLLTSCTNTSLNNCYAGSTSTTSSGTNAYGIELSSCSNCSFTDCFANGNSSASGDAAGFIIGASPVNSFTNCSSSYHQATGGDALGFDIQASSNSCTFEDCKSSNSSAVSSGGIVYGFKIAADGNYLNNCIANKNNATHSTGGNTYGMYLSSSDSNRIINSQMNNATSTGANSYGAYLTSCTNTSFTNCQAKGNVATPDDSEAVGFFSNAGSVNRFESCTANGQTCSGTTGGSNQLAAGFKFQGNESRSQIISSETVGNNGGGGSSSRAYGIFLAGTSSATDCIVKDTLMAHNTVSAGRNYGFYDGANSISTVLLNNTSINHGQCLVSATLNASNQFLDVVNSGMNYFYNHDGTGDDPRFTIAEAPKYNLTSISTSVGGWESISLY
jgi:hypothetical protein